MAGPSGSGSPCRAAASERLRARHHARPASRARPPRREARAHARAQRPRCSVHFTISAREADSGWRSSPGRSSRSVDQPFVVHEPQVGALGEVVAEAQVQVHPVGRRVVLDERVGRRARVQRGPHLQARQVDVVRLAALAEAQPRELVLRAQLQVAREVPGRRDDRPARACRRRRCRPRVHVRAQARARRHREDDLQVRERVGAGRDGGARRS